MDDERRYTQREIGDAVVRLYNSAIAQHAAGETSHEECLGAKTGLVALLHLLEIPFEMRPGEPSASIVEEEEVDPGPRADTEGPHVHEFEPAARATSYLREECACGAARCGMCYQASCGGGCFHD